MKNSDDISKKIEETLGILDRIGEVEPKPFFYTRLMARIGRYNEKPFQHQTAKKLQYAFLGLVLLLAINGFSLYKLLPSRLPDQQGSTMETFIENYQLDVRNFYTISENDFN
jgi:hypothetical protein